MGDISTGSLTVRYRVCALWRFSHLQTTTATVGAEVAAQRLVPYLGNSNRYSSPPTYAMQLGTATSQSVSAGVASGPS